MVEDMATEAKINGITGVVTNGLFALRPADVLLADEINRTTPRTQSALLEAMAERQVAGKIVLDLGIRNK